MAGQMRVSVVATGIDVIATTVETPVARRRLAEPLPHVPAEVAAAHAPAATPKPAAPIAASVTQQVYRTRPDERSLFDSAPRAPREAELEPEDLLDAEAAAEAEQELPPPAYRPQPAVQPIARELHVEDDASAFVAPRPRTPGSPTPEALARLQAAVTRAPSQAPRAAAQPMAASRAAAPAPATAPEKPRFAINSFLNRMTGGSGEHAGERRTPTMQQTAQQPQVYDDEPASDPEQDRIEIPAFLRRQAN